jgi:hypothetical protein
MHALTTIEENQYFTRTAKHSDLDDLARQKETSISRPRVARSSPRELAGDVSVFERERAAIVAAPSGSDLKVDELAKKRKLAKIDKAIAVAKSPWIFPSRRDPGRHVSGK